MKNRNAWSRAIASFLVFVMLMCPSFSLGTVFAETDEAAVESGSEEAGPSAEEATPAGDEEDVAEPVDEAQPEASGSEPVTDVVNDNVTDDDAEQPEEQSEDSDSGDAKAPALRGATAEGDADPSEVFKYSTYNNKITITGYTGTDPIVDIPATIGGVPVTEIGASAFAGNTTITEVTIPYGVTDLNRSAFADCTSLQTVNCNADISVFVDGAFSGCTALTAYNFGEKAYTVWRNTDNTTYGPAVKEFNVAEGNEKLKSIDGVIYNKYSSDSTDFDRLSLYPIAKEATTFIVTDNIEYISSSAFAGNAFLEEVTLPSGLYNIGDHAFRNCTSLAVLNYNCHSAGLGSKQFAGCTSLTTVNIGKDVTSVPRNDYNNCFGPAVKEFNVDPENTYIKSEDGIVFSKYGEDSTTFNALSLYPVAKEGTSYTVPEDIRFFDYNCISGNKNIEEVTITAKDAQPSWTEIFSYLPSLKTLRYPASVNITHNNLGSGNSLEKLSITEGDPDAEIISYIPERDYYLADIEVEIGKGVTNIDVTSFLAGIKSYTIDPENDVFFLGEHGELYRHISDGINGGKADPSGAETELVDIPDDADITEFTPLETTTLIRCITNNNVKKIDLSKLPQYLFAREDGQLSYAMRSCPALEEIDLGYGMTNVPSFKYDTKLAALHLFPTEPTEFEGWDFDGCSALKVLELAGNITSFASLSSLSIEELSIGEKANCRNGDIDAPVTLKTIKVNENNENLKAVDGVLFDKTMTTLLCYPASKEGESYTIPNGVTRIGCEAFYKNKYLSELIIPDGVTTIDDNAFYDMANVFVFRIPASVTTIGSGIVNASDHYYTFIGKRGSAAHQYCIDNNIAFIDEDEQSDAVYDSGECYNEAEADTWDGTAEEPVVPVGKTYVISTAEQLAWVASQVNDNNNNFSRCKIVLAADLDMDGIDWTPIGTGKWFRGSFDGQNHTISNLTVSKTASSEGGLFGRVTNSVPGTVTEFKNVIFENTDINRSANSGVLTGVAYAAEDSRIIIDNVIVTKSCSVAGTITGGIVGCLNAGRNKSLITISNCQMRGCVDSSNAPCGGILGAVAWMSGKGKVLIVDTKMLGEVNGHKVSMWKDHPDPGGIVGNSGTPDAEEGFVIRHCLSFGSVWTDFSEGAGGIAGKLGYRCVIEKSVNYSNVTGGGYAAGGIVGVNNGTVRECYNQGTAITGTTGADGYGGIAGKNNDIGTIINSYTFGETAQAGSSLSYGGGLTGANYGKVENCYVGSSLPISFINTSIAVTGVGAVASLPGGSTTHTYFVDSGDADHPRYLFATYKKTGIVDDPDNNIVASGGMTLPNMRVKANFVNWDFNNIWDIDDQHSNGMPYLRSVKDLLMLMPKDADESNGPHCKIQVVDQDNEVVEKASVTYNGETIETDLGGTAHFTYTKDAVDLSVSKDGYTSYRNSSFRMTPARKYVVRIVSKDALKDHPLSSVRMTENFLTGKNEYELLTQTVTVEISSTGSADFKVVPADSSKNYTKYELMQGEEVIATSTSPSFSVPYNDFIQSETVEKDGLKHTLVVKETSIRLTDSNGDQVSENINLTAENAALSESTFSFGMDDKIAVPKDEGNVLSGWELEKSIIKVPVTVKITDTKWTVSINVAQDKLNYVKDHFENEFKTGFDMIDLYELQDEMAEEVEKENKALKGYAQVTQPESPAKVTFDVIGYAEGDLPLSAGKRDIKVGAELGAKLKRSRTFVKVVTIPSTPPVLAPVEFDIDTSLSAKADTYIKFDPSSIVNQSWVAKPSNDNTIKITAAYKPGITISTGIPKIATAGVYGEAKVSATGYVLPEAKKGLEKVGASGGVKLVIRLFGSNAVQSDYLVYDTVEIYKRNQTVGSKSVSRKASLAALGEAEPTYIEEADAGAWTGGEDVLQAQAYSASTPVLMKSGNDTVMIFLSNTSDRATADDSVLLYSVYNSASGSFSDPQPVDDDGFADFSPVACDGRIAWIHAKKSLGGSDSMNEISTATEVKTAVFNSSTGKFENIETITNNSDYEANLKLDGSASDPVMAWTVNSDGDMTGASGSNTVYTATYSGGKWNVENASSYNEALIMTESGKIDGKNCTVSIVGEGGALHRILDGEDTVIAQNAAWAGIADNSNKILWLDEDGILYSMTGSDGEAVAENTQGTLNGAVRQIVEGSNGELAILYTRNGSSNSNAYYVSYDKANDAWSGEIAVTAAGENEYAEYASAVFENGELFLTWNQRNLDATKDDLLGTNTIRKAKASGSVDLVTSSVSFIKDDVAAGAELPIRLAIGNQGMKVCSSAKVEILKGTDVVSTETVDLNLQPGTIKQIEQTITLPSQMSESEYTVKVTDTDSGKSASSKFTLGSANFSIDREVFRVNGKYRIAVTVNNNGYNSGKGKVEFYNYADPDEVYESADLQYIGAGSSYSFETELNAYDWDNLTSATIGIRAVDANGNIDDDRTVYVVDPEAASQTKLYLNKTSMILQNPGDTEQLELSVLPSAANTGIVWKSSNEEVATVDQNGRVTAVESGKAVITAATEDGSKFIRCAVQVGDGTFPVKTFTVTFNSNGGSGSMDSVTVDAGSGYTLPECGFTAPEGQEFNGWNLGAVGDEIIINDNVELKAQWKDIQGSGDDPDDPPVTEDPYNPTDATAVHKNTSFENLQSAHNYGDNINEYWYYNAQNAGTESMEIRFSDKTETESGYDYIYVYDGAGKLVEKYNGTELAGKTMTVDGNKFAIRLASDSSNNYYGFKIVELKELSSSGEVLASFVDQSEPDNPDDPDDPPAVDDPYNPKDATAVHRDVEFKDLASDHDNGDNLDEYWYYNAQNDDTESMQITFSYDTRTESGCDYIYIYDGDGNLVGEYSGDDLAGETITVDGNRFAIRMTTDESVSSYGFKIEGLKELDSSGEVLAAFVDEGDPDNPDNPDGPDNPDDPFDPDDATGIHSNAKFEELESEHDYGYNIDEYWYYSAEKTATRTMQITFSDKTETEEGYDFISIYNSAGQLVGQYSGTQLKGQTINVKGNKVAIRLTSDSSESAYGFKVAELKELNSSGEVVNQKTANDRINIKDVRIGGLRNFVYTGRAQKLSSLVVTLGNTALKAGVDYTVAYRNNVNVGVASVVITGTGEYTGTKTASFTILPKPTTLKSVKGAKKKFTVKWNKQAAQITGYQIQYSTKANFAGAKTKVAGVTKAKLIIKKLKSKKKYYVRIRTYKKVGAKTYFSAWSGKKKVKTK